MTKTSSKKTSETTNNPRNTFVAAMMGRYGKTTTTMGDRRKTRGGQRNRQRDYMSDNYLLYHDTEEEGEDQMKTNYDRVTAALAQLARVYSETFEGADDFWSLDCKDDRGEKPWKASIDSGSCAIEKYGLTMEESIIVLCIEVLRGPWSSDRKYRAIQDAVKKLLLECTY